MWNVEDVGIWVERELGVPELAVEFMRLQLNGRDILEMVEADLVNDVGVEDPLLCHAFMIILDTIRNGDGMVYGGVSGEYPVDPYSDMYLEGGSGYVDPLEASMGSMSWDPLENSYGSGRFSLEDEYAAAGMGVPYGGGGSGMMPGSPRGSTGRSMMHDEERVLMMERLRLEEAQRQLTASPRHRVDDYESAPYSYEYGHGGSGSGSESRSRRHGRGSRDYSRTPHKHTPSHRHSGSDRQKSSHGYSGGSTKLPRAPGSPTSPTGGMSHNRHRTPRSGGRGFPNM